ncbi:MAG: glutathione ABC transporter ATP-binding protein GsiA [Saprospiraceae bacterium]
MQMLKVKDLEVVYETEQGLLTAVQGLGFELAAGEVLGVVGESGSGKTALSLALMGLLPPNGRIAGGEVRLKKTDGNEIRVDTLGPIARAKLRGREMAMIFQEPMTSLNPVFRCGEQVAEVRRFHFAEGKKAAKEKALELFRQVQFDDPERIYRSYPHQLSGGQRQRVMIAMALAGNPSLLIADEPTSALDVTVQREILLLLKALQQDWKGAMLFISHDLHVVRHVADKVLVMKAGEVVEQGGVEEVFRNPKHPYTKQLIDDSRMHPRKTPQVPQIQSEPLVAVRHLKTWFPSVKSFFGKTLQWVKAVDDVSLSVFPGETLGIVGESGSGKSTLGRSLLLLEEPQAGEVLYQSRNLATLEKGSWKKVRKDLQIIFQDLFASLNPRLTVGQSIIEPMAVHGIFATKKEREAEALRLLKKVGLEEEHFHRLPEAFSGGQRQRICIARALALQPRFLICDECVSALDVTIQARILDLLMQLKYELGLTYIFISHDLAVVRSISDRIAVMKDGKVVEIGEAEELFRNPQHPYTKELLAASLSEI